MEIEENEKINKQNYNLVMENQLTEILAGNNKPSLLLHSCCAPCSSYVIKLLQKYFKITVLYYNDNIFPKSEYVLRFKEQKKLIKILNKQCRQNKTKNNEIFVNTPIKLKTVNYCYKTYKNYIKNYENDIEGGQRCYLCYELRINKTANLAKQNKFDYFSTTLSVSPYKNVNRINKLGEMAEKTYNVKFLYADFKKQNGYKQSIELSKNYELYRQDYCGCEYSLKNKK